MTDVSVARDADRASDAIKEFSMIYEVQDVAEVQRVIGLHPELKAILLEAHAKIVGIFGQGVALALSANLDPEEAYEGVLVTIRTDTDLDEALDRLEQFDLTYWLDVPAEMGALVTWLALPTRFGGHDWDAV